MNWEAIGAIAELLGAIGVIATLAYLAVQIRQNTSTVRISAASALAQSNNSLLLTLAQDPDVSRIWWTGLADPTSLSEADRRRFDPLVAMQMNAAQQAHSQFLEGASTQRDWTAENDAIEWLAAQPGFVSYWERWSSTVNSEFAQVVTEALQRSTLTAQQSTTADSA